MTRFSSGWRKNLMSNRSLDYSRRYFVASVYRFMRNFLERHQGHLEDEDFFKPVADRIPMKTLRKIFNASAAPSIRRVVLRLEKGEKIVLESEDPDMILLRLWEHPATNQKFRAELMNYLDSELAGFQASLKEDPAPDEQRFQELKAFFKLSDPECDLLLLSRMAVGFWSCDGLRGKLSYGKFNRFASLLGIEEGALQQISNEESRLRKLECIDEDLDFNRKLLPFLSGADKTPLYKKYYCTREESALPWEYFGELSGKHGELLVSLLSDKNRTGGLHILFYGTPGTGKTSFAQSLAKRLGRQACFIENEFNRFTAIQVCELQQDKDKSIIVIDEADKLLDCAEMNFFGFRRTNGDKGELNQIMDSVKTPCIWIANTPAFALDPSSRRRFDYSIEFKPFSSKQRAAIWKNSAQKHQIDLPDKVIDDLAARYAVSAGGVELALRNYPAVSGKTPEEKIARILEPHCQLMQSPVQKKNAFMSDYQLDGLNIKGDIALAEIESAVGRYLADNADDPDKPRMNLLLSGPPGTGKTEFVKYLGHKLKVPVVTKMGSDILSMWVGGTERNIAAAFEEAEQERGILFFDEIDGLLQNRERAQRNWEVSQVNELLHHMENFSGVMIGATNFSANLDRATLRRFTFKLQFDYLDGNGKKLFFEKMFHAELSAEECEQLSRIPNLAPGDFRTVRQGLFYLGGKADNRRYLAALEQESASKQDRKAHRIGF